MRQRRSCPTLLIVQWEPRDQPLRGWELRCKLQQKLPRVTWP
jgi:hypothetical protein